MNVFRAALSSDFWITGIAIAGYIPRAFRTKQIDGNLFFREEKRQEYRRRVESVTLNSRRKWGTMEVDQMLHHLNLACGGSQGFYGLPDESYLMVFGAARWLAPPDRLQNSACTEISIFLREGAATQNPRGRLERDNRRTVEASSNVRQNVADGVGQASANPPLHVGKMRRSGTVGYWQT
jgi:hypothetical protein